MSFKSNGKKRDFKKILSAVMCFIIALMFFWSLIKYDFSVGRLVFGIICLYFASAFFRSSNEY